MGEKGNLMTQNDVNNSASDLTVDNLYLDGNTLSSTDINGNIVIAPDGTGVVSVTTAPVVPSTDRADSLGSATNSWDNVYADGISFNDGSDVLATYVSTDTFTPVLEFGGGTTGITYSTQTGSYTQVGELVWIVINLILTNKGSSTGTATISGLPVVTNSPGLLDIRWNLINLSTNYTGVVAVPSNGLSVVGLNQVGDNAAFIALTDAEVSNSSQFFLSGAYITPP